MDMRINGALSAYENFSITKDVSKREGFARSTPANDDLFSVSSEGRDYQTIRNIVANVPDIREDRVASIKAQMENGTYNVSAVSVARKILESASSASLVPGLV